MFLCLSWLFVLLYSYRRKETSGSSHCRGTTVCCRWVSDTFFFIGWVSYLKHRSSSSCLMWIGNFRLTILNLTNNYDSLLNYSFILLFLLDDISHPLAIWLSGSSGKKTAPKKTTPWLRGEYFIFWEKIRKDKQWTSTQ